MGSANNTYSHDIQAFFLILHHFRRSAFNFIRRTLT